MSKRKKLEYLAFQLLSAISELREGTHDRLDQEEFAAAKRAFVMAVKKGFYPVWLSETDHLSRRSALRELTRLIDAVRCELRSQNKSIVLPPGMHLARMTRFLLSPEAHRRYVEPAIADMQHQFFEAMEDGNEWYARWIVVRGHLRVIPGWFYAAAARLLAGAIGFFTSS